MAQNTSSAVMQQRIEPNESLDDFPTPSWGTRALVEHILKPRGVKFGRGWEPAANRGYMVRAMLEYFDSVHASDVFDYSPIWPEKPLYFDKDGRTQRDGGLHRICDFLFPNSEPPHIAANPVDWIFSNPPFRLAEEFIARARGLARVGTAMLVRTSFLEGQDRYKNLFSVTPPTIIAQFSERIILTKGIVRDPSKPYWDEEKQKMKRPSTATSYCWLVWLAGVEPQPFQWIPPCRVSLERQFDYPDVPALTA